MYRLGIESVVRQTVAVVSPRGRREQARNRADIERLEPAVSQTREQILQRTKSANGIVLLISMDGLSNVLLQLPVIAGIASAGFEPVMLLPSKESKEQRFLYSRIGIRRFAFWDEGGRCQDGSAVMRQLDSCKTQDDLLKLHWNQISIGKFAVSTLMRRLRAGSIDPSKPNVMRHLQVVVRRTLDHAYAALTLLDHWQPVSVIFIDRGYTPEGPMFDACIQRGLRPATMNSAHRDNALIFKRYGPDNANVHPVSLSDETWRKLLAMPWSEAQWEVVRQEIEYCYRSGQWYGEVATQFNTRILDHQALQAKLKLDPAKRTVLLFPHIFWDATFFWGVDVFGDYEEWFRESVRIAWRTPSVNWIIKIHPANVVKNIRDGTNAEFSEEVVLKEFGAIPTHICIIPADTDISTLSLFSIGHVCLTVRGTVGIEAAAFGLSVVTAGTGRYDRLGFTRDVKTRDEYFRVLESVADLPAPTPKQTELARRYAFGAFMVRPLDTRAIRFSYSRSRSASLEVAISDAARTGLFGCEDVEAVDRWLRSGAEDTPNDLNLPAAASGGEGGR
jgi:hypothetical protein